MLHHGIIGSVELGAAVGSVLGLGAVAVAHVKGLRGRGPRAVVALGMIAAVLYRWCADAFGWWTPGSWARASGAADSAGEIVALVLAMLVAGGLAILVADRAISGLWPSAEDPDGSEDGTQRG